VGFGLFIAFLGLTLALTSSIIYKPLKTSCGATTDYVVRLYEVVSIGLCITIIEFITSLLGGGKKEADVWMQLSHTCQ
jgi:hypothetical protein